VREYGRYVFSLREVIMKVAIFFIVFLVALPSIGQEVVLTGTPSMSIEIDEFGERRAVSDRSEVELKITKTGDSYFWASRGNVQLALITNGIYETYVAVDGSGYIRTINETARARFLEQIPNGVVGRYTYFEHISTGFSTKTVYGR